MFIRTAAEIMLEAPKTDRSVLAVVGPGIPGTVGQKGLVGDHIYTLNSKKSRPNQMIWIDKFCRRNLNVQKINENQLAE